MNTNRTNPHYLEINLSHDRLTMDLYDTIERYNTFSLSEQLLNKIQTLTKKPCLHPFALSTSNRLTQNMIKRQTKSNQTKTVEPTLAAQHEQHNQHEKQTQINKETIILNESIQHDHHNKSASELIEHDTIFKKYVSIEYPNKNTYKDYLFWAIYLIMEGYDMYHKQINSSHLYQVEMMKKYEWIETINMKWLSKDKKKELKKLNITPKDIIQSLGVGMITPQVVCGLGYIFSLNIIVVLNHTYIQSINNFELCDSEGNLLIYVIYLESVYMNVNKEQKKYKGAKVLTLTINKKRFIDSIRGNDDNTHEIEVPFIEQNEIIDLSLGVSLLDNKLFRKVIYSKYEDKPLEPISKYKLNNILEMTNWFGISLYDMNGHKKKKQQLYDELKQYILDS